MTERTALRTRLCAATCRDGFRSNRAYLQHVNRIARLIEDGKSRGAAGEPSRATAAPTGGQIT